MPIDFLTGCLDTLTEHPPRASKFGRIQSVVGLLIEATGVEAAVGELCHIYESGPGGKAVPAEVVGIRDESTLLMPLAPSAGLRAGSLVRPAAMPLAVRVGEGLLGRVIDSNGQPIDGKGPLRASGEQPVHADPPPALQRAMINDPLVTGVRAIDAFTTIGRGQRVGIFAGSGVGKSTLLGMIARQASADVNVIALIGERSREVQEFILDNLGPEGLAKSVVVAVTGDQAAMSRVKGASVALAVAEYFRDQGKDVMLMMDSVTRVAMAQREIGLAIGEPPTTRGYTPSVFALLPRLLERAGPGTRGTITGIFTVLVDGDDMNDPISDAVRGILDGHIVLSRKLAHANHFPAIDVLQSVSRVMGRVTPPEAVHVASEARSLLAAYEDAEDLIRVGAYSAGSDARTDRAVQLREPLTTYLKQGTHEKGSGEPARDLGRILKQAAA